MKSNSNFFSSLLIVFSLFAAAACATPPPQQDESFDPESCNEQAGFERGMNDGRKKHSMNTQFARRCREDLQAQVYKGYREGYDKGSKMRAEEDKQAIEAWQKTREPAPAPRTVENEPPKRGTVINVNFGGKPVADPALNDRAYYCSVKAFMTTFDAFGPTMVETKKKVLDRCKAQYHEMHCDDIQCEKNQ